MAKLDFNDDEEKKLVESVFNNAIDSLSDDDKKLPQVHGGRKKKRKEKEGIKLRKKNLQIYFSGRVCSSIAQAWYRHPSLRSTPHLEGSHRNPFPSMTFFI
jgi:hypothetical protein